MRKNVHSRMRILKGIARGERAIRRGRTLTHAQAVLRLKGWLEWPEGGGPHRQAQGGVWGLEASLDVSPKSLGFRFSTASTLKSLKSE